LYFIFTFFIILTHTVLPSGSGRATTFSYNLISLTTFQIAKINENMCICFCNVFVYGLRRCLFSVLPIGLCNSGTYL
jgi:hypothetical protein